MIGRLHGVLLEKQAPELLIDVNGVGYEVLAPMTTHYVLPALGQNVTLHTHLVVREDAQQLFGFATHEQRALFRELIKVSGVGPKLALTILSGMDVDDLVRCVRDNNLVAMTKLPGVGKKTAERLLIDLRDRLKDWRADGLLVGDGSATLLGESVNAVAEAESALVALGYKPADAAKAIAAIKSDGLNTEVLIRQALKNMLAK